MTFIELTAYHRGTPGHKLDPERHTKTLVNVDTIRTVQPAAGNEMSFITFHSNTSSSTNYMTVTEGYEDILHLLGALARVPA